MLQQDNVVLLLLVKWELFAFFFKYKFCRRLAIVNYCLTSPLHVFIVSQTGWLRPNSGTGAANEPHLPKESRIRARSTLLSGLGVTLNLKVGLKREYDE